MVILQTIFFGILFIVGFVIVGHIFGFLGDAVFNKAEKEAKKGNGGCLSALFIIIAVFFVVVCIMQLKDCANNYSNQDSEYWENTPRHTD